MNYNPKQTMWRKNLVLYLLSLKEFREDLLEGKIDEEKLESFGVMGRNEEDTLSFYLIEESIDDTN